MCRVFLFIILSLKLVGLSSCGGPQNSDSVKLANQKSLDDLAFLVSTNPELSGASLQEIKSSAEKSSSHTSTTKDINFVVDAPAVDNSKAIKPEVAQKAQSLIDDILDQFDFATELTATFKITGIFLTMQKERLKQFEAYAESLGTKGEGGFSKFDPNSAPKDISCEAFMDNPFTKIPKEKYDQLARVNRELIKKTISGCPNLVAEQFIQCIGDFNQIISAVNQHATCDIKSLDELEQVLDRNMNGKYHEKNNALKECLSVQFAGCGFNAQKI